MKVPVIISPVKSIKDIDVVAQTSCNNVFADHSKFLEEAEYNCIMEFIKKIKEYNFNFFINFRNSIQENEITKIINMLDLIKTVPISGIMLNSIEMLDLIRNKDLAYKVYIDSGLHIHNLAGVEFINLFHSVDNINITEEIYIKNLVKIKKYTKNQLSIDSNDLPWIAAELLKSKTTSFIYIKDDFNDQEQLLQGIRTVEKILENPKNAFTYKLSFKNPVDSIYKSNHFLGEFQTNRGETFKFTGNIQPFSWKIKRFNCQNKNIPADLPKLNLKLTSLEQLKSLKRHIKSLKYNPVYSVEYGEIVNTADLSKYSFNRIIEKAKKECFNLDIKFQLSTPKILIERDFDRVFEYVKMLCIQEPIPSRIIINNIGFLWAFINDPDLEKVNIELGQGLNLLNSVSINSLANIHHTRSVDFSNFTDIINLKDCVDKIKDIIPIRKFTIAGAKRINSMGLCPLNNEHAVLSRLSCVAPCHHGNYAIYDPAINIKYPFSVDGFCRMHLFQNQFLDLIGHLKTFSDSGINEFSVDFNCLPANFIPTAINRFLFAANNNNYTPVQDSISTFKGI